MNRRLLIKLLEQLMIAYPKFYSTEKLRKRLKMPSLEGEFTKIIQYLKATDKIIINFAENKYLTPMGYDPIQRDDLDKEDEIAITPLGIDFLMDLKKLDADENKNRLSLDLTLVLTQIAIIGIILTLYDKLNLNFSPEVKIPLLLSGLFWFILISFLMLLFYKIINIIFSRESWKGIFLMEIREF